MAKRKPFIPGVKADAQLAVLNNEGGRQAEHKRHLDELGFPEYVEPDFMRHAPVSYDDPCDPTPSRIVNQAGQDLGDANREDSPHHSMYEYKKVSKESIQAIVKEQADELFISKEPPKVTFFGQDPNTGRITPPDVLSNLDYFFKDSRLSKKSIDRAIKLINKGYNYRTDAEQRALKALLDAHMKVVDDKPYKSPLDAHSYHVILNDDNDYIPNFPESKQFNDDFGPPTKALERETGAWGKASRGVQNLYGDWVGWLSGKGAMGTGRPSLEEYAERLNDTLSQLQNVAETEPEVLNELKIELPKQLQPTMPQTYGPAEAYEESIKPTTKPTTKPDTKPREFVPEKFSPMERAYEQSIGGGIRPPTPPPPSGDPKRGPKGDVNISDDPMKKPEFDRRLLSPLGLQTDPSKRLPDVAALKRTYPEFGEASDVAPPPGIIFPTGDIKTGGFEVDPQADRVTQQAGLMRVAEIQRRAMPEKVGIGRSARETTKKLQDVNAVVKQPIINSIVKEAASEFFL